MPALWQAILQRLGVPPQSDKPLIESPQDPELQAMRQRASQLQARAEGLLSNVKESKSHSTRPA